MKPPCRCLHSVGGHRYLILCAVGAFIRDSDFRAQWKISVVGASKDFCALRARVPPRGTSAEVGHTTPGLRSSQSLDRGYPCFSPIGAVLAACFTYTQTIGKSNMLLSKGPVPLGNCPLTWAHDLSLDFAAWQTIVRCVAFYHSLLSERSFSSMLQSK